MVSTLYQKYSRHLLIAVALSFPVFTLLAESLPSNNDIETWLPRGTAVRENYEDFKRDFGVEEVILVGVDVRRTDPALVEALSLRIQQVPGIRSCWSPQHLRSVMQSLEVPADEIAKRLSGLSISHDGTVAGLVALLSDEGAHDRAGTVERIRAEIDYCQLAGDDVMLAGAPVVVAELDRLGSRQNNRRFFSITILISVLLLYYLIRQWKLTLAVVGLTVWAINATLGIICLAGGEMNFILGALAVMIMVFTLSTAIHVMHYFAACRDEADPLGRALALAWKPCGLATLTTFIGLISLAVSDIGPVRQFGISASLGAVVALVVGLGITPALLVLWPLQPRARASRSPLWDALGERIFAHSRIIAVGAAVLVTLGSAGLVRLQTRINPLEFLPRDGRVMTDVLRVQSKLTSLESIEAVVDFGHEDLPFVTKLERVRELEALLHRHPSVTYTMSLATFFPSELPDTPLAAASLLNRARSMQRENEFTAQGETLWRISARVEPTAGRDGQQIFRELQELTAGHPVTFTGIAPLITGAQQEIFNGFWESFATAFLIITAVMIVSLWSLRAGLVAMVPNLAPVALVFGTLGWIGFPVDIGMMMCASIALGIAVDGTFHFLVRYAEHRRGMMGPNASARRALRQTAAPITQAAFIGSVGMLALTFSSFTPTARFGTLMAVLLVTAVFGDLVLLPALLSLRREKTESGPAPLPVGRGPHVATRRGLSKSAVGSGR